jgi:RecB family exonuclease
MALALTGRGYVSYSALATYQQCPLRYYFRYVEGLPEETVSASLVFGGAIHAAVEHHFRELLAGSPPPPLDDLLGAYEAAWQERDLGTVQFAKDDDERTLAGMARRMLVAFQSSELARPPGTILGVEEELREELIPGVPDLLARVDLLVDTGDELVITDLKTARSRWSLDQVDDSAEQILLYGEVVRRLVPGKRIQLQFGVLTKAKAPSVECHTVHTSPARTGRTLRIVERVWNAIQAGHFYPAPSPLACPACPFRGPCRVWTG